MFNWLRKLIIHNKPAENPHRDGFVYWVILIYEQPPIGKPVIRVKNDGAITGDKFLLPHQRDTLTIQFGGEQDKPPVFAQIQVSDVEDFRPYGIDRSPNWWWKAKAAKE